MPELATLVKEWKGQLICVPSVRLTQQTMARLFLWGIWQFTHSSVGRSQALSSTSCPIPSSLAPQASVPVMLCIYRKNTVELQIGAVIYSQQEHCFQPSYEHLWMDQYWPHSLSYPTTLHPPSGPGQLCLPEWLSLVKIAQVSSAHWIPHLSSKNLPHLPGFTPSSHSAYQVYMGTGAAPCIFRFLITWYYHHQQTPWLSSHLSSRLPC